MASPGILFLVSDHKFTAFSTWYLQFWAGYELTAFLLTQKCVYSEHFQLLRENKEKELLKRAKAYQVNGNYHIHVFSLNNSALCVDQIMIFHVRLPKRSTQLSTK